MVAAPLLLLVGVALSQPVELVDASPKHRLKSRRYKLPRSGMVNIEQLVESESVGASQWDAGFCLADYVERSGIDDVQCDVRGCSVSSRYLNKTVLVLGAGAGGLDAISLVNAGARVLATDIDESLFPRLVANVHANTAGATGEFVGATRLAWADRGDMAGARARLGDPDYVVGSDVTYHLWFDTLALVETLVDFARTARRAAPEILLAHTFRYRREDEDTLRALDEHFTRTVLPSGPACHATTALFRLAPRTPPSGGPVPELLSSTAEEERRRRS